MLYQDLEADKEANDTGRRKDRNLFNKLSGVLSCFCHKEAILFPPFVLFLSTGSQKAVDGIIFLNARRQSTKKALSNH